MPIAPSKTTMALRVEQALELGAHASLHVRRLAAHGVVLRLRMMDDDRRRALLGNELERARQLHAELAFRRQDLEQLRVILEIGARAVAPRIALALSGGHAELVTNRAMHPFGDRFRGFDRECRARRTLRCIRRRSATSESAPSPRRRP